MYNESMKNTRRLSVLWVLWLLLIVPVCFAADSKKSSQNPDVPATPEALESQFVRFVPNFPLMPGSLNLYGYETDKLTRSAPVLSPDKNWMAVSEVYFMPTNQQTYSRVSLHPVGSQPAIQAVLPPEQVAEMEKQKQKSNNPTAVTPPQVNPAEVNPKPFWARYQPEKQMAGRQVVTEAGFDRPQKYHVDLLQVVDWSANGDQILIIQRSGVHHLGVFRTLPLLYDVQSQNIVHLSHVPKLIWNDFLRRYPEQAEPAKRVWDIRPLGWSSEAPQSIIVKLVVFEGQSELPAGYWSYSIANGTLTFLDTPVSPEQIAHHGWLVQFTQPTETGEIKVYAPGETPPIQPQSSAPKKRSWGQRLQFWKKQR